jgi:arginine/serine-rich splicing factor 12
MTLRYIQVANVSTACQKEQLRALFAHFGRIDELYLFPESETLSASVGAKVGYIKFEKNDCAYTALQMSNTVFLDRSLICSLVKNTKVPVENDSLKYCASLSPNIVLLAGGATWPNTVIHRVIGIGNNSYIETIDPELSEHSLPLYPQLPGTLDPIKAEEIRRTVYVSNISKCVTLQNLNDLFSQAGEIRFIRFAGDENADCKCAYVEFSEQPHIVKALCLNGTSFASRTIK